MQRNDGWSLVELLVVIAVVTLLAALALPSFAFVRERARLTACAASMHNIHMGLMAYAAMNRRRLPPFAFSDWHGNLPLSGHWGGSGFPDDYNGPRPDPNDINRRGMGWVNLWALVHQEMIAPDRLVCPAAAGELRNDQASYFPYTRQFSTYCLRFPTSEDLFAEAPDLADYSGESLLDVYRGRAGGQLQLAWCSGNGGETWQRVPLVRTDMRYRIDEDVACGDGEYDVASDMLLSDAFWRQEYLADAASAPGTEAYSLSAGWCHGERFNVLDGGGSVRTVEDDGTIEAHTISADRTLSPDGAHYATYAERIWWYFDAGR